MNLKEREIILVTVHSTVVDISRSASFPRNNNKRGTALSLVDREPWRWLRRKACDYSDKLARYFQRRRRSVGSTALDHSRVINYRPATLPPRRSCADRGTWRLANDRKRDVCEAWAKCERSIHYTPSAVSCPPCLPPVFSSWSTPLSLLSRVNMGHGLLLSRA